MLFCLVRLRIGCVVVYYLTRSVRVRGAGVAVEIEELVERVLGGVHVGEDALCSGSSWCAVVVEQHGFLDPGQGGEEFTDGHVQSGLFCLTAHEVRDGEREDAVERVNADFLVGPVVHRGERHHVRVLQLPEPCFDLGLGPLGGHNLRDGARGPGW